MTNHLHRIDEAHAALADAWEGSLPAFGPALGSMPDDIASVLEGMSQASLAEVVSLGGALTQAVGSFNAACAAAVAARSTRDAGPEGMAKKQGFTSPEALIASATGTSTGEAKRLMKVGEATTGPLRFNGDRGPAKYPHVATALADGGLSVNAAGLIAGMLDRVSARVATDDLRDAEAALVAKARATSFELVEEWVKKTEADLHTDAVAATEQQLRDERYLHLHEERSGAVALRGRFDPETAAPIIAAINTIVSGELRRARDAFGSKRVCTCGDDCGGVCNDPALLEERTIAQMNADALADAARHVLGCTALPVKASATVVVRTTLEALQTGIGTADIDGIAQPISASAARRIAASADIIPVVLGTESEVLDQGRKRRLFTPAQKIAIGERDGGCAFPGCPRPPQFTQVHHMQWWKRDDGPSNLINGVLLCSNHHHITHHDKWAITLDDHFVTWFTPPASLDPERRPRRGNSARRSLARRRGPTTQPSAAPPAIAGIAPVGGIAPLAGIALAGTAPIATAQLSATPQTPLPTQNPPAPLPRESSAHRGTAA